MAACRFGGFGTARLRRLARLGTVPLLGACLVSGCGTKEQCGLDHPPSGSGCWSNKCALSCGSTEEAVACCVRRGGRGVVQGSVALLGDSGWWDEGTPAAVLSPEAAMCIAQVHGLPSDVLCGTSLVIDVTSDAPMWAVWGRHNLKDCGEGSDFADVRSTIYYIDAMSGALVSPPVSATDTVLCE